MSDQPLTVKLLRFDFEEVDDGDKVLFTSASIRASSNGEDKTPSVHCRIVNAQSELISFLTLPQQKPALGTCVARPLTRDGNPDVNGFQIECQPNGSWRTLLCATAYGASKSDKEGLHTDSFLVPTRRLSGPAPLHFRVAILGIAQDGCDHISPLVPLARLRWVGKNQVAARIPLMHEQLKIASSSHTLSEEERSTIDGALKQWCEANDWDDPCKPSQRFQDALESAQWHGAQFTHQDIQLDPADVSEALFPIRRVCQELDPEPAWQPEIDFWLMFKRGSWPAFTGPLP